jgi:hypothetical protein
MVQYSLSYNKDGAAKSIISQYCKSLKILIMAIFTIDGDHKELTGWPSMCPFCHNHVSPGVKSFYRYDKSLEAFVICPNPSCKHGFIAYFVQEANLNYKYLNQNSVGTPMKMFFEEIIEGISPQFVLIYNQAYFSEQHKLLEISGVGYRKSLEFLLKDYLISKNNENKEDIEGLLLGKCIQKYITNDRIKSVAKRAAWLGNDETHYVRKWEGKNLADLKKLIDLTVHWIGMEMLTDSFGDEMPD